MKEQQARRAFALAALVLTAVIGTLAITAGDERDDAADAPNRPRIAVSKTEQPGDASDQPRRARTDPHGHGARADAPARRAARNTGRRFLGALLRYQTAEPTGRWRPALRATAAPRLARDLLEQPPRPPRTGAPPHGRIKTFETHGPLHGVIRASALVAYDRQQPSLVDLELRKRDGRWRVTDLYR